MFQCLNHLITVTSPARGKRVHKSPKTVPIL